MNFLSLFSKKEALDKNMIPMVILKRDLNCCIIYDHFM